MYFVMTLPHYLKSNNHTYVIMDQLTWVAYFIPFCMGEFAKVLAEKYKYEVMRLYGIPICIVLNQDM